MKFLSKFYMVLIFAILYAPILIVILFSFNESGSLSYFSGFTTYWYQDLFRDREALAALKNSLLLACASSVLATIFGTLAAFSIAHSKSKVYQRVMKSVSNIPMMNPDIVTGVSMMLLFVGIATILKLDNVLGFWTMLFAHTTFNLPYVILSILPKFKQMDKHLIEAALDLGCTPTQTFFRVELPAILPGIISGLMMSFTLSLDDFVISYFTTGASFKTFPTYIYSLVKKPFKPNIYALSSIMTIAVLVLLIVSNIVSSKGENASKPSKPKKQRALRRKEAKG